MEIFNNENFRYGIYVSGTLIATGTANVMQGRGPSGFLFAEGIIISAMSNFCGRMITWLLVKKFRLANYLHIAIPDKVKPFAKVLFDNFFGVWPAYGFSQLFKGKFQPISLGFQPISLDRALLYCTFPSMMSAGWVFLMIHVTEKCCAQYNDGNVNLTSVTIEPSS